MQNRNRMKSAAALAFALAAVLPVTGRAQQVHLVAHPDHPDHHAIYLTASELSIEIREGVAHAVLHQTFANPNPWRAEGIYLFPLPEGATVTDFRLTMNGEPVRGEVLSAERARSIYLDIVRRIRDPALMEWVGHRVFRARIFPFEPRGERELHLSWAQSLPREGDYRVFRYLTGQGRSGVGGPLIMRRDRPAVPDRIRPVLDDPPRQHRREDRRTVFVVEGTIDEDYPVRSIYSPTHPLAVEHSDENTRARFSAEGSLWDREGFALYYDTGQRDEIGLSLLTHRPPHEDGWFLLTITPADGHRRTSLPRDVIFVLDTSGSMEGDNKLAQAVAALDFGLGTLGPEDRFAVVTYNSTVADWGRGIAPADRRTVATAREYIRRLRAGGGTNIAGALELSARLAHQALEDNDNRRGPAGRGSSNPAYVIFLTDGLPTVGEDDPDALLELAAGDLPREVRLFTWGVGYDVNAFLLDRLAAEHGGQSAYVEPHEHLEEKVSAFFSGVSTPLLTDLEISFPGAGDFELYPAELPDLFAGSEITVLGRFRGRGPAEVRLTGRAGGREESVRRRVSLPERERAASFLAPMWAQRKVGFLLEQIRLHRESTELREEIVELGERYGIVTPYTSYLVIEENMMRFAEELEGMAVPAAEAQAAMRMAREAVAARSAPDRSVYSGRAGARDQTGAGDIQLSVAEQTLQNATIHKQASYLRVQRVVEKTFELQETGAWRDQALRPEQRLEEVEVGSWAFLTLLERHAELARYAAIGEQIEVELDGQGYLIVLPE